MKKNYEVSVLYSHETDEVLGIHDRIDGVNYFACPISNVRVPPANDGQGGTKNFLMVRPWERLTHTAKVHLRTHFNVYPRVVVWPLLTAYMLHRLRGLFYAFQREALRFEHGFDLIVANDLDTLPIGAYIKERNGGILIYDSHENWGCVRPDTPRLYELGVRLIERRYAGHADLVTTVSPLLVRHLEQNLRHQRVILLPNAAPWIPGDEPERAADRWYGMNDPFSAQVRALAQGRVVATFQGRVTLERGLREIVAAWAHVPENRAILIIRTPEIPNTELEAVIKVATANGTFRKTVFHLPSVSENELISAARSTDIGIIPYKPTFANHIMACPNKLSQYMQAGLAVFSNDIPYVRNIVEEAKCGAIYSTSEGPERIADSFTALCGDQSKLDQMKSNSIRYVREKYNWDAFYFRLEKEVERLSRSL